VRVCWERSFCERFRMALGWEEMNLPIRGVARSNAKRKRVRLGCKRKQRAIPNYKQCQLPRPTVD